MDPERVNAYLQAVCAVLGFDIGEVWWTTNEVGSPSLAAIDDTKSTNDAIVNRSNSDCRNLKFVQLYTSKSYEDRKSMLLSPDSEGRDDETTEAGLVKSESDSKKHVLSPQLVNAISSTSQVLWANSQTHEGFLGRSDLPLQTAVGMPVAVDGNGNMCVVVMFSPENLQNTDDAMEYLQFISKAATSSSIPCLFPVFDAGSNMQAPALLLPSTKQNQNCVLQTDNSTSQLLDYGIPTRFAPLDADSNTDQDGDIFDIESIITDMYGMPILPPDGEVDTNPFDDASFGIWATVMNTPIEDNYRSPNLVSHSLNGENSFSSPMQNSTSSISLSSDSSVITAGTQCLPPSQKEKLEEFSIAFLGMSIFDAADAWIPHGPSGSDELRHVTSVSVETNTNGALTRFAAVSQNVVIKPWSGAVGRAFASGNTVWSSKHSVIVDSERLGIFDNASIRTALAVPIFSSESSVPVCVVCYYSIRRNDPVAMVLRFVQQALRLLWDGLDKIKPHDDVGKTGWSRVAPADLGEMAGDFEMQQEFLRKKRPRDLMSSSERRVRSSSLSLQLQSLKLPSQNCPSIEMSMAAPPSPNDNEANVSLSLLDPGPDQHTLHTSDQLHEQDTGRLGPWNTQQHISTNSEGTKRAHIVGPSPSSPFNHPLVLSSTPMPSNMHCQQSSNTQEDQTQMQQFTQQQANSQTVYQSMHHQHASLRDQYQPVSNQSQQHHVLYQVQQPSPPSILYTHQSQPMSQLQISPLHMPQPLPNQFVPNTTPIQAPIKLEYMNHVSEPQNSYQYQGMPLSTSHGSLQSNQTPALGQTLAASPCQIPSHPGVIPPQNYNTQCQNGNIPIHGSLFLFQPPSSSAVGILENGTPQIHLPPGTAMGFIHIPSSESGKQCRIQGCDDPAVARRPYCTRHSGNRLCENVDCEKCAQGSTRFCIAHGGGRRCTFPGCDKGARDKQFCAAHGGGKRCHHPDCSKSAVGGSNRCTSHGGGRRCTVEGCDKSAQSSTSFCVKHGGGKKCEYDGCEKVARGRTNRCAAHGGGIRCKLGGCSRVAIGRLQLCRVHGGGSNRCRSSGDQSPPLDPVPFIDAVSPIQSSSVIHNI